MRSYPPQYPRSSTPLKPLPSLFLFSFVSPPPFLSFSSFFLFCSFFLIVIVTAYFLLAVTDLTTPEKTRWNHWSTFEEHARLDSDVFENSVSTRAVLFPLHLGALDRSEIVRWRVDFINCWYPSCRGHFSSRPVNPVNPHTCEQIRQMLGRAAGHWNNENLDRLIRKQSSVTNPPDQAVRANVIEHLDSDLHGCISLELIKFIINSPSASAVQLEHYWDQHLHTHSCAHVHGGNVAQEQIHEAAVTVLKGMA